MAKKRKKNKTGQSKTPVKIGLGPDSVQLAGSFRYPDMMGNYHLHSSTCNDHQVWAHEHIVASKLLGYQYLYFTGKGWLVGASPCADNGWLNVADLAEMPRLIRSTWQEVNEKGMWQLAPHVALAEAQQAISSPPPNVNMPEQEDLFVPADGYPMSLLDLLIEGVGWMFGIDIQVRVVHRLLWVLIILSLMALQCCTAPLPEHDPRGRLAELEASPVERDRDPPGGRKGKTKKDLKVLKENLEKERAEREAKEAREKKEKGGGAEKEVPGNSKGKQRGDSDDTAGTSASASASTSASALASTSASASASVSASAIKDHSPGPLPHTATSPIAPQCRSNMRADMLVVARLRVEAKVWHLD